MGKLLSFSSVEQWAKCEDTKEVYEAENGETPYTKEKFVLLCQGDIELAYGLFCDCDWQCPETILDEEGGLDEYRANYAALK